MKSSQFEIEKLIAARALIEDESHWCQGMNACRADGTPCPTHSPEAMAWCAEGACIACDAYDGPLCDVPGVHSLAQYNDTRTHADVLDVFDYAINRLLTP